MIQQYESIGDFTKFKISDIGKVFNTLTKNLYPNPLLTVLIETVSNAHDSMVMCQKGLEPIFIKYNLLTSELSIQDTGEGMSPEFMEDGYTDVGRSGKENVVEAIGRYGLGRLSILAYAPQYFVDTIWDKVKYTYLISENPLSTPDIELVNSQTIDACNGVTVRLTLKSSDISKVEQYINQYLRYFPTLIVEGLNFKSDFTVYEGKTFKTITNDGNSLKILNGCTLFPIDFGLIERPRTGAGQVLKFDLKEGLVATPNRADLIWTPETIKKVQEKYDSYVQEQQDLFNEQVQFTP
jgi:HSP90 family molecular chaperone